MFRIHGGNIFITRGDAAAFRVTVRMAGELYEQNPLEKLLLRVYDPDSGRDVLRRETEPGSGVFSLAKEDTCRLRPGEYGFDVKLLFPDGSVSTIVGPGPTGEPEFVVLEG